MKILALVSDGGASNEGHRHLSTDVPAHHPDARPLLCKCKPCVSRREAEAQAIGGNVPSGKPSGKP